MEESGENAQPYTQFGWPLSTFIMFPKQKGIAVRIGWILQNSDGKALENELFFWEISPNFLQSDSTQK